MSRFRVRRKLVDRYFVVDSHGKEVSQGYKTLRAAERLAAKWNATPEPKPMPDVPPGVDEQEWTQIGMEADGVRSGDA